MFGRFSLNKGLDFSYLFFCLHLKPIIIFAFMTQSLVVELKLLKKSAYFVTDIRVLPLRKSFDSRIFLH